MRPILYWTDAKGDDRIVYVTPGYRAVCLDAKTGALVKGFRTNGSKSSNG